jgi:hypothetical protein
MHRPSDEKLMVGAILCWSRLGEFGILDASREPKRIKSYVRNLWNIFHKPARDG